MAVGEREDAAAIVVGGRHGAPLQRRRVAQIQRRAVEEEWPRADAAGTGVGEDERVGGCREVWQLVEDPQFWREVIRRDADEPIHRQAAPARVGAPAVLRRGLVVGAFPNLHRFVIAPEMTGLEKHLVGVVGDADDIQVAAHPSFVDIIDFPDGTPSLIGRHLVVVVPSIQHRRQPHLLLIAQALNALRLGFRFAQCGQKHRRENRDDGDDDEQFDEGEPVPVNSVCSIAFHGSFFVYNQIPNRGVLVSRPLLSGGGVKVFGPANPGEVEIVGLGADDFAGRDADGGGVAGQFGGEGVQPLATAKVVFGNGGSFGHKL